MKDKLKKYRVLAGYTQRSLSIELGHGNAQYVSNIERGLADIPLKSIRHYLELIDFPKNKYYKYRMDKFDAKLKAAMSGL